MRKRMVDPDIWEDEKILELDLLGKLLFVGIITIADDEGRLRGNAKVVKAKILPADNVDEKEIEKKLKQLNDFKLIHLYTVNNEKYIQITNWYKHQKLRKDRIKPSIYPSFNNQMSTKCQPNVNQMSTKCQPDVNQMADVCLTKVKKSKENNPPFILPLKVGGKDFLNSLTLPEKLKTQEFQDIWISWIRHRQEIRHTLKSETAKRQLAFLAKQPNPVACIEQSIRQGWQGLFPVGYEKKSIIDDRNQIKRMFEPTNEELDEKYKNFR